MFLDIICRKNDFDNRKSILTLNSRDFAKGVRYVIILFRIRLPLHGGGWTYERNKDIENTRKADPFTGSER